MKLRNGFVSNSSSSSFVIDKSYLTEEQIERIKNYRTDPLVLKNAAHWDYVSRLPEPGRYGWQDDSWMITEEPGCLLGYTSMDNFSFGAFLLDLGVPEEHIHWDI